MPKFRTHYDNLQVSRAASDAVIRAAYRSLSQLNHPDKHPNNRAIAERRMKIINQAYKVLSDPEERRRHDRWIIELEAESLKEDEAARQAEAARKAEVARKVGARNAEAARKAEAEKKSKAPNLEEVPGGVPSTNPKSHQLLVFTKWKTTFLLFSVGAGVLVLISFFIMAIGNQSGPNYSGPNDSGPIKTAFELAIGLSLPVLWIFFAWFTLHYMKRLFVRIPVLVAGNDGIKINEMLPKTLLWSNIREIKIGDYNGRQNLIFTPKKWKNVHETNFGRVAYWSFSVFSGLREGIYLDHSQVDRPLERLLDDIKKFTPRAYNGWDKQ